MKFHFCAANHNLHGAATLDEMYQWFAAGLSDLGHSATFSLDEVDESAINLFWEYFPPGFSDVLKSNGIRYGIVATEIPDGGGFNWRRETEWLERWNGFADAAANAAFIWTTVESAVDYYAQFAKTAFLEFGYSAQLENSDWNWSNCRQDFCFYGMRTPYRLEILRRLEKHASVEWPDKFLTRDEVGRLLSRSKICINFKQSTNWPIPSPTRLGQILHSRRWAACEYTSEDTKQSSLFGKCAETEDFSEYCLSLLETDLEDRSITVFENYRRNLQMKDIMNQALEKTIDCLPKPTRAARRRLQFPIPVRFIGAHKEYNLLEFEHKIYGVPQGIGPIDLSSEGRRLNALISDGLIVTATREDLVRAMIDQERSV